MKYIRHFLLLACLAALAAASGAQGLRPPGSRGITDIMRAGPRLDAPMSPPPASAAANAGAPVQHSAEFIVALVNSEPITNTDVQLRVTRLVKENEEAATVPRAELTRLVLDRLILERAQLQLAKENGIKVDDVAIDQAEQTVARNNQVSLDELHARVTAEGITLQQFRSDLHDQLLLTRLRDREVASKVRISDTEVEQYMLDKQANEAGSAGGAGASQNINIAQVLVAVPENATPAQVASLQQRAEDIAKRARAGEDFTKLAQTGSDAPDRANGGALGMRTADRYPPLFVEATQSTPVNGIAGPVRSGAGFHVLKVLAKAQNGATSNATTVTQTQVRHILLLNDPKRSTEEVVAQLAEFKRRLTAGTADFASLARDNSQDASAKEGGDLGWARPGQFVPEFEEAMNRLAPGQVSDPVVSRFGVHLIQVVARREVALTPTELREAARIELREKRLDDGYATWLQEVRARAYVEYRDPPQ